MPTFCVTCYGPVHERGNVWAHVERVDAKHLVSAVEDADGNRLWRRS